MKTTRSLPARRRHVEAARDREGEVNRSERHAVDDQEFWLGNIRELRGHFY
jgi:hypothetical protein